MVWNFLTDRMTSKSPLWGAGWYKFVIP